MDERHTISRLGFDWFERSEGLPESVERIGASQFGRCRSQQRS